MSWLNTLGGYVGKGIDYLGGNGFGNTLARAGLGAGIGAAFSPKMQKVAPVSAAQLNAATVPQMQNMANRRLAYLQGAQGGKGGISSSDLFERSDLRTQLGQKIGQQKAINSISAQQQMVDAANRNFSADSNRFSNILAGGLIGANLGDNPWANNKTADPNADETPQERLMRFGKMAGLKF